jgi:hypothetical protein
MMNDLRSPLRRIAPFTAVILVAMALAGCAKKVTSVDASYTAPEGQLSADARLIVYPDAAIPVETWTDVLPSGPGEEDLFTGTEQVSIAPGTLHGTILDGTPASGYQVMRREGNGGYAQLKDYVLSPVVRFLDSQWEMYAFSDARPSGFSPPSYLGRGVIAGVVTPASPLTNTSELMSSDIAALQYTGATAPRDSNFTMSWNAVPNAAGYWIQIYQFTGDNIPAILQSVQPAPFVLNYVRNFFIGYVAAPATGYKLGEPGAQVLVKRPLLYLADYRVRVVAVNGQGELIAFSYGDWQYLREQGLYRRFRAGSITVIPTRPKP